MQHTPSVASSPLPTLVSLPEANAELRLAKEIGETCRAQLKLLPKEGVVRTELRQWLKLSGAVFSDVQERLNTLLSAAPCVSQRQLLQEFTKPLVLAAKALTQALSTLYAVRLPFTPAARWAIETTLVKQKLITSSIQKYASKLLAPTMLDLSRHPAITDDELFARLAKLRAPINRLNIAGCNKLSVRAIHTLIDHCEQLVTLNVNDTKMNSETLHAFLPKIEDNSLTEFDIDTGVRFSDSEVEPFVRKCKNNGLTSLSIDFQWCTAGMCSRFVSKCQSGGLRTLRLPEVRGLSHLWEAFFAKAAVGGLTSCTLPHNLYDVVYRYLDRIQDGALSLDSFFVPTDDQECKAFLRKIRVGSIKGLHFKSSPPSELVNSIPDGTLEKIKFPSDAHPRLMEMFIPKCKPNGLREFALPFDCPKRILLDYHEKLMPGRGDLNLSRWKHADEELVRVMLAKCPPRITHVQLKGITVLQETWDEIQRRLAPPNERVCIEAPTIVDSTHVTRS